MSKHFHDALQELNDDLLKMGTLVEELIAKAITALKNRDVVKAQHVIDNDQQVDALELVIEEKCLDLMARHQPVAVDLRFITTGLRINGELELIADLAVDIAACVLEIADQPLIKPLIDIPKLELVAQRMIKMALDSFIMRDVLLAKQVIYMDAEADHLKNDIHNELIEEYLVKDGLVATRAIPLIFVARHLERACDHASTIAENVIYMVNAKVVKHHPERLGLSV